MPRGSPLTWLTATLAAGLFAGCQAGARRTAYADNPLILSRQPLEAPAEAPGPERLAQFTPLIPRTVAPPPLPASPPPDQPPPPVTLTKSVDGPTRPAPAAWTPPEMPRPVTTEAAASPPNPPAGRPAPQQLPAPTLPGPELGAAPTRPAPRTSPPVVASARRADGKYGAARDYTWLQGELDRHYRRGHLELRFRPPSEDDAFGGKVRLENDPRLAEFHPGDVVVVEGELIRDPDPNAGATAQYPRYHIRDIRLIERK
jgi:hypothetical protein